MMLMNVGGGWLRWCGWAVLAACRGSWRWWLARWHGGLCWHCGAGWHWWSVLKGTCSWHHHGSCGHGMVMACLVIELISIVFFSKRISLLEWWLLNHYWDDGVFMVFWGFQRFLRLRNLWKCIEVEYLIMSSIWCQRPTVDGCWHHIHLSSYSVTNPCDGCGPVMSHMTPLHITNVEILHLGFPQHNKNKTSVAIMFINVF